jgi:hypothetical protein
MGNHGKKVFFMGKIGNRRQLTLTSNAIYANNRQILAYLVDYRKQTTTYSV